MLAAATLACASVAHADSAEGAKGKLVATSAKPAEIVIDDQRGAAPLAVEVPPGEHLVVAYFADGGRSAAFALVEPGRTTDVALEPSAHRTRFDVHERGLRLSLGLSPALGMIELGRGGFIGTGGRAEVWLRGTLSPAADMGVGLLGGVDLYPSPETSAEEITGTATQLAFGAAFEARMHAFSVYSAGIGLELDVHPDASGLRLLPDDVSGNATALFVGPRFSPAILRFGDARTIEIASVVSAGPYVVFDGGFTGFRTNLSIGVHYVL